jgi:hypothetical protein
VITIPAAPGGSVTADGNIEYDGDNDWFEFVLAANTDLTISTANHGATLPGGCRIYLYDNDGATHDIPLNAEIEDYNRNIVDLRNGEAAITNIHLRGYSFAPRRYWIRVRSEIQLESGIYELQITR